MRRILLLLFLLPVSIRPAAAQAPAPSRTPEPPLRRWFEFQQFALGTRYRYIQNSADTVTFDHMQYRDQIRGRVNLDAKKHYTINAGFFSGTTFISSWDNLGPGNTTFDGKDHFFKQLFVSATPVPGIEGQFGGLYVVKGESTEYTSYDDDGYLVGWRASVRRPQQVHLDEISVTSGHLGPASQPNLRDRWGTLDRPNYTQVLVGKRVSQSLSASADYTHFDHADTLRAGAILRFTPKAPVSSIRYEQYVRTSGPHPAAGFSVTAERAVTKWVRLQGGYTTIDQHYGGLNADRIQRGRRFFVLANVPIWGPLSAQVFATQALRAPYAISNDTRFDTIVTWDVLNSLRKTGVF